MGNLQVQQLFSFLNFVVVVALLANGIDHWAVVPFGFVGYFASSSIVLGLYLCLASVFLLSLEFKALESFYMAHANFLMKPLGRGLLYISILTAGSTWYQILSVILVLGIGVALLLVQYRAPDVFLVGIINYPTPKLDSGSILEKAFEEPTRSEVIQSESITQVLEETTTIKEISEPSSEKPTADAPAS
ncbi:hypothetical protein DSO57_1034303 [Entomophthora muscae]|uniref:Uncharacterized protein n=1 Tax=Entomophthora muscae TaxID=34485 RepID=A0ACC2RQX1_9FUNG|nr:hypothetical protein DSO57_1034303 [Entomophthora muscae]